MELERYRLCAEAAKKNAKAERVLKNANVVNVFTGEVIKGDVAIAEGIVVGVGQFEGIEERDMEGKYLCPGFIDSHLHLESTGDACRTDRPGGAVRHNDLYCGSP